MSDLTESRVRIAIASLRLKPKSTKKRPEEMPLASPRTRNSYLRSILQFCNWLVRDRRMQDNPLSSMRAENVQVEIRTNASRWQRMSSPSCTRRLARAMTAVRRLTAGPGR